MRRPVFLAVRPPLLSVAMADVLGVGQNFGGINVSTHKSLRSHLDYVKKRDILQGSQKLPAMRADAGPNRSSRWASSKRR